MFIKANLNFSDWALRARVTDDPVGDFVSDFRRDAGVSETNFPDRKTLIDYLRSRGACPGCLDAVPDTWKRYTQSRKRQ